MKVSLSKKELEELLIDQIDWFKTEEDEEVKVSFEQYDKEQFVTLSVEKRPVDIKPGELEKAQDNGAPVDNPLNNPEDFTW